MRNQCRSVGGVWCRSAYVMGCVRACLHGGLEPESHSNGLQRARGNTETRNGAGLPRAEQLVSGGSRPGGQAGRGWYLFETRSDVGSTGAKNRLRKRAGPRKCCLCEDSSDLLLRGDVGVVEGRRRGSMLARQKHHELWYGGHERRRVWRCSADCGRLGEGRAGSARVGRRSRRSRERACTRSEALRYARAIGISTRITIGGRWRAAVVTLSFDRGATPSCIVAEPLVFLHQSSRMHSKSCSATGLLDTPKLHTTPKSPLLEGKDRTTGYNWILELDPVPGSLQHIMPPGDPDHVDTL